MKDKEQSSRNQHLRRVVESDPELIQSVRDADLRDKITTLRRERDAHQMDESDYVDSVVALIAKERITARLSILDELEKDSYIETKPYKQNALRASVVRVASLNNIRRKLSAENNGGEDEQL
jgi:hypothetical protein